MRNHIITIILLLIAVIVFALRFFVAEAWQNYCAISTFVLPTIAALVEIVISEKSSKATEEIIKKLKEKQLSVHVEGETLVIDEGVEL